jgi:uncharacterized membrane protein YccC
MHTTRVISPPLSGYLTDALTAAGEPLLFGLRLWASVCLALFITFWLELDNPFWAGASAAIVCLPQLGASLRKGWFRMIGTMVGATMVVVLTGCFPQDRIAFLGLLALWGALCAFVATALRNFASYGAALAGYTAAIIAVDNLGATGGASPDIFLLAITRASEICIGIVCAGVVLAGTDLGGAQRRLAVSFADLAAGIAGGFTRMLALAGPRLPDAQTARREFVRRVIALDPTIDQALGESSRLRYHSSTLQSAVYGLLGALDGWRGVATHLSRGPNAVDGNAVEAILRGVPAELRSARESGSPAHWIADPSGLRRACADGMRRLLVVPAGTSSLQLLSDETAKVLAGMVRLLDGLALLVDAPVRSSHSGRGFTLAVPDWLPAVINAGRAFVVIVAVELFWVATAWPNGASPIIFATAVLLLLSPRGDLAYLGAIAVGVGVICSVLCAAIIKFAVLPAFETFPAFCAAIGLFLIPVGFAMARSEQPATTALFNAMGFNFVPLLAPTNVMSYDTRQFYNSALAIVAGCCVAPLAFVLLPPLSPAQRTRRLLRFALRDLRRLAIAAVPPKLEDWESRMYGRLAAVPDQAEPLQRARLLAALSVGAEIIHLRRTAAHLGASGELDAALAGIAQGNSTLALAWLRQLDRRLGSVPDDRRDTPTAIRARSRILVISEALSEHGSYFDDGAAA